MDSSPNNDGINDVFMIFGGPDVVQVNTFKVFDRWGETVFEQNNFQPNDPPDFAWEGTFRNSQALNTSVFCLYSGSGIYRPAKQSFSPVM